MLALRTYILFKLSFWVFLFIPLYFIVDGYRDVYINRRLMMEGKRVQGTVIGLKEYGKSDKKYVYTVSYTSDDSIKQIVTLKRSKYKRSIGSMVFLYYLPSLPHIAKERYNTIISRDADAYLIVLLLVGSALYFLIRFFLQNK